MSSQMDWFKDEEKKREDVEAGVYKATLTNATLDETKGAPRLTLEYTLESRRKVWQRVTFNENVKWKLQQEMRALGVYDKAKEIAMSGKPATHAFLDAVATIIGIECEIAISYREGTGAWAGKQFQDVKVEGCGKTIATSPTVTQTNPAVKNHAPTANAPAFKADEEMPDFMR